MKLYIGTSGWQYYHWYGKFYPQNLKQELKDCIKKIKKLKPKNLFVYFNNDFGGYAIENAFEFKKLF